MIIVNLGDLVYVTSKGSCRFSMNDMKCTRKETDSVLTVLENDGNIVRFLTSDDAKLVACPLTDTGHRYSNSNDDTYLTSLEYKLKWGLVEIFSSCDRSLK